jgi:hypothetical protein
MWQPYCNPFGSIYPCCLQSISTLLDSSLDYYMRPLSWFVLDRPIRINITYLWQKTANERANLLMEIEVLAVYTTTYMVGVVEAAPVPTTTPLRPSRCPSSPATTAGWATARLTTSSFYMRVSFILSVYAIQSSRSRECE